MEALPARYRHCQQNVLRLLDFYRALHVDTKSTAQKKIPKPRKAQMPNLSGLAMIQRERAFEEGEFREDLNIVHGLTQDLIRCYATSKKKGLRVTKRKPCQGACSR